MGDVTTVCNALTMTMIYFSSMGSKFFEDAQRKSVEQTSSGEAYALRPCTKQ